MTRFRRSAFPSIYVSLLIAALVTSAVLAANSQTSTPDSTSQAPLRPATNIRVSDTPNDAGGSITVRWDRSLDDTKNGKVRKYVILRAPVAGSSFQGMHQIGDAPAGDSSLVDGHTDDDSAYVYVVRTVGDSVSAGNSVSADTADSEKSIPIKSSAQWFDLQRINVFVGVILLSLFIIYYIRRARSGKELFIRKIAGLEAVDEAVGRATEMGRKIYFIPGSQDMDQVQTLAGITILGRVAEIAAQYEAKLDVPVSRSLVMVTCREVVKEAYAKAGRPDSFQENQVHYLTDDQFGYAAAIDGMVVRERPATIFMLGLFYAESLILAETGNSVGAIQIAGTGEPSQLPFFVAACDYTLIGEELFAASAYLSKEPMQLGSLKGQDIGKGLILILILIGILLESLYLYEAHRLFTVIGAQ